MAIIHYWLVSNRGGERVLERLCKLYPNADIFTHVYDPKIDFGIIKLHPIQTTFISKLPFSKSLYQHYLPLMPLAIEQLNLTNYDLIISSEAGPAKGAIRHPDAKHICYVHSPMRYIWDQYPIYRSKFGRFARAISPIAFHYLRHWDYVSAQRIDTIAANSEFVSRRIRHVWGRASSIIYPPVAVKEFTPTFEVASDFYLWVGQLVPYKCPEVAVEACTRLKLPLIVVGAGPMKAELTKMAGPTVKFIERLSFTELKKYFRECRALLYTGVEDFGITPVEVMASARPVIALGRGGVLETVQHGQTGLHFSENTVEGLADAIADFSKWIGHFNPQLAVDRAASFAPECFDTAFRHLVECC